MSKLKNIIKISVVLLLFSLFLCACDFINQNNNTESEYKIIYKAEGNGYIVCDYDNNARIKSNTEVVLKAIANTGNTFNGWFDENDVLLDENDEIKIVMNKKWILIAKFEKEGGNTPPIVEDEHDKIKDLSEGKESFIKADVIVTFKNGFLIKDDTGYALVYLGTSYKYSCGDTIEFKCVPTTYKGKLQIPELIDVKRVGYVPITTKVSTFNSEDISSYLENPVYGKYVCFDAKVVKGGTYYDFKIGDNTNYIYPYNYDESIFHLDLLENEDVKVYGYLWGSATSNNISVIIESVEDNSAGENKDTIVAYFNEDWSNPFITINNYNTYKMTLAGDHYEYKVNTEVDTVVFSSGDMATETLDFDTDSYVFVLGSERYNGKYDGYFTDSENKDNEVIKITTLELNDVHGYIEQVNGMNGISNASYLINQIRDEDDLDNVVLAANGDIFQGTAISNLTRGRSIIDIMNAMEFDFMGIGNHEFDWGLEEIFKYFDGNSQNGEANFPLINSNVYFKDTGRVVLYDGYNIVESLMIEKEGVKIGIVSCIGMLKSSILATRTEDYNFESIVSTATPLCKDLKDNGADIIIVNLHDGSSAGVNDYATNSTLANIKYKGKNLIDAIINGHTHNNQFGYAERDGADVPITQAACNCTYLGELNLYFDKELGQVVYSKVATYNLQYTVGRNYDESIQNIVDQKYNEVKDQIEETYCIASATVSQKNSLFDWAANVMLTSVGADCAISNTGGIRSTGKITKGEGIKLGNMFEIIPFDNEIILCEVSGAVLKTYLQTTSNYYGLKDGISISTISNSKTYKVAVIDYVYYGNYFMTNANPVNTHVIYREALIEDLKLRDTFNVNTDKVAVVGLLYQGN